MRETLHLSRWDHYGGSGQRLERTVEVEYRRVPHYMDGRGSQGETSYEVYVDGKLAGTVESIVYTSSTTYKNSMIRRDLGQRREWSYRSARGKSAATYAWTRTRMQAVARMLGFDMAKKVKREVTR